MKTLPLKLTKFSSGRLMWPKFAATPSWMAFNTLLIHFSLQFLQRKMTKVCNYLITNVTIKTKIMPLLTFSYRNVFCEAIFQIKRIFRDKVSTKCTNKNK
jgi:hypothetical protein